METVIVCEDYIHINNFYCMAIKKMKTDYAILSTDSTEKTLEQLAGSVDHLKLAIIDGKLNGTSMGWDLAEKLREMGYQGPIVYIGTTEVPADKKQFFTEFDPKGPNILGQAINIAEKYLK